MLSVVHHHHHPHQQEQQPCYVQTIQTVPSNVSLSDLPHMQVPVPRTLPSSRPLSHQHAHTYSETHSTYTLLGMSGPQTSPHGSPAQSAQAKQDASVAQALEIARESPDGASDPTISHILETALTNIWAKVMASPEDYVMTRDEFSVFNFFQQRFEGNDTAVAARRRYWDNASA